MAAGKGGREVTTKDSTNERKKRAGDRYSDRNKKHQFRPSDWGSCPSGQDCDARCLKLKVPPSSPSVVNLE